MRGEKRGDHLIVGHVAGKHFSNQKYSGYIMLSLRLHGPASPIEIVEHPEASDLSVIPAAWVISGEPQVRLRLINQSTDTFVSTFVWSCTAGRFHWHFSADETVHVLEGEVLVTDDAGREYRLLPGSIALFRAGSHSIWHVPNFVKKMAVVYEPPPRFVSHALRALRKLKTWLGIKSGGLAA